MKRPEVHYFPETDSMFIVLSDKPSVESYEAAQDIVIAVDADGDAVSIEVPGGVRDIFSPLLAAHTQQRRAAS